MFHYLKIFLFHFWSRFFPISEENIIIKIMLLLLHTITLSVRKDQDKEFCLLCVQWLLRGKRKKCELVDAWGRRETQRGEQALKEGIKKVLILGLCSFWSLLFSIWGSLQKEYYPAKRSRANNTIFQVIK